MIIESKSFLYSEEKTKENRIQSMKQLHNVLDEIFNDYEVLRTSNGIYIILSLNNKIIILRCSRYFSLINKIKLKEELSDILIKNTINNVNVEEIKEDIQKEQSTLDEFIN